METFLIRALQLILCLSLLVFLHEGGHFLMARLFKVRVKKFALFFDPWFSLLKFKPKKSHTTYVLGWVPLGGYVQIDGMVDETQKASDLSEEVHPWEFRAKPAWQRLLIMLGGVIVNFLVALFIYAMILFVWGDSYVPIEKYEHGFKFNTEAKALGFQDGDILISTNRNKIDRFDRKNITFIYQDLTSATSATVLRGGKEVSITLPGDLNMLEMAKKHPPFITLLEPAVIDSMAANEPAAKSGKMHVGDKIVAYNGVQVSTWNEIDSIRTIIADKLATVTTQEDSVKLRNVSLVVQHADGTVDSLTNFALNENYQMGVFRQLPQKYMQYKTAREYGLIEAIPAGIEYGWKTLKYYVLSLKYVFTADGAKSVGSFGAIGSLFPASWDWMRFWEMTAFIGIILAFMNVLPIPALDGGHVLFLLFEMGTRRKPSDKFMTYAEYVGMTLILLLMAFAIFNDFRNFVF